MPFDLERDDELARLLESDHVDEELKDRNGEQPARVSPLLDAVLDDEPDGK